MLNYQKDSGLQLLYVIFIMFYFVKCFLLKIVLVLYFIKIKATCFDILKYVYVVSACLCCEH